MGIIFWLFFLFPVSLASVCSSVFSCYECDNIFDADGDQTCEWCLGSESCVPAFGLECVFGDRVENKLDCPVPVRNGFEYNDTFARKIMMPLSGAAYSTNPQACLTNAINGATLKRQITAHCDATSGDTCSGYSAVSHYHKAIILSFRGTNKNMQLFLEGVESILAFKVAIIGGGSVSRYFYDGFDAIWSGGMIDDLLQLRQQNPTYELWVTGHSLGGAMASVASNVIVASGVYSGDKVKLITFGQPRTGNHEFGIAHDSLLPYKYRVTHGNDMVPHVPTLDFESYHHHRYEVWYDNDMIVGSPYIRCLMPEDESCSNSNTFDLSIEDHTHYFGVSVSEHGIAGCK